MLYSASYKGGIIILGNGRKSLNPVRVGDKYGELQVSEVGILQEVPNGRRYSFCRVICSCGKVKLINEAELKRGHIKSCGCVRTRHARTVNITHGLSKTPAYRRIMHTIWKCDHDLTYITRGIKVCAEWRANPGLFAQAVIDLGPCPDGHSLNRSRNDDDYMPGNIVWSTHKEQARNRSNSRLLNFQKFFDELPVGYTKGKLTILDHELEETDRGFVVWTIVQCDCDNATVFKTKFESVKNEHARSCGCLRKKNVELGSAANAAAAKRVDGMSLREIADAIGGTPQVVNNRLKRGWTIDRILATPVGNYRDALTANGESHTIPEWEEITGVDAKTIRMRRARGDSPEEAIRPVEDHVYEIAGVSRTISEWSKVSGTPQWKIYQRISRDGWSIEEAVFGKKAA